MVEWQTKHLANMLVGLAQDKEQSKAMAKMVEKMVLPLADEDRTDTRPIEQVIEEGALIDIDKQPTFGQLSAALGAQAR
jgi:tRNA(Ile2) C34 agmatinyltransferase TiaS